MCQINGFTHLPKREIFYAEETLLWRIPSQVSKIPRHNEGL